MTSSPHVRLAKRGVDLQHMPQHYVDYEEAKPEVRTKAQPVAALGPLNPGRASEIEAVVRSIGRPESELGWVPLKGDKRELTAFVRRTHWRLHPGRPLHAVEIETRTSC
jgi:hypothetical protein